MYLHVSPRDEWGRAFYFFADSSCGDGFYAVNDRVIVYGRYFPLAVLATVESGNALGGRIRDVAVRSIGTALEGRDNRKHPLFIM